MHGQSDNYKIRVSDLSFYYGSRRILDNVQACFAEHAVTAIVGPSGQGKSTLLTTFNRLWEEIGGGRLQGTVEIRLDGRGVDIYRAAYPLGRLRRKVGMLFQEPNPLPMSIFKNVAFPLRLSGVAPVRGAVEAGVESALRQAFLWEEVKDRLKADARTLSGGQQQRLCIARALMARPEVLLLDEPTASLDSRAAGVIEELLISLKSTCTLIMVSHYMDQVRRVADRVLVLADGRLSG
jgi:phosphate transport system ATP-binding protein